MIFTITANDSTGSGSSTFDIYIQNYSWWGMDVNADLDGTGVSTGDVQGLGNYSFANNTSSLTVPEEYITTTGEQYIHFLYPDRIGGSPSFFLSGWEISPTLVTSSLSVTNANGYVENYRHYRTENAYTDMTATTFSVKVR